MTISVGDIVVWNAQSSQRLAAIVTAVHDQDTVNLKVLSDNPNEDIFSGEGSGGEWEYLHRNVSRGNASVDEKTKLQAAQLEGRESWLTVDETQIDLSDSGDVRLKAAIEKLRAGG